MYNPLLQCTKTIYYGTYNNGIKQQRGGKDLTPCFSPLFIKRLSLFKCLS